MTGMAMRRFRSGGGGNPFAGGGFGGAQDLGDIFGDLFGEMFNMGGRAGARLRACSVGAICGTT